MELACRKMGISTIVQFGGHDLYCIICGHTILVTLLLSYAMNKLCN